MTVSVRDVHRAMTELGELRFGATPVGEAMHKIVQTTHAIFHVDGAGLMLVDADDRLRSIAVSDKRFEDLEALQVTHDEGPCMTAYEDRTLVCAEDLGEDGRWPQFSQAALDRGLRAVLASPIPYNQQPVGVVGVVSEQRRPWAPEAELALLAFTDLAALLIASMLQAEQQGELAAQLQTALDSRTVVEQAKGVLIARSGVTPREALEQLRGQARRERRKLGEVAAEVVAKAGG